MKYEKTLPIIVMSFLFISCNSSRILLNNKPGNSDYREVENEIRERETNLVISGKDVESTSKDIESTSKDIKQSISSIESAGKDIEQSIEKSSNTEQSIEQILQSVRRRKLPDSIVSQLENIGSKK